MKGGYSPHDIVTHAKTCGPTQDSGTCRCRSNSRPIHISNTAIRIAFKEFHHLVTGSLVGTGEPRSRWSATGYSVLGLVSMLALVLVSYNYAFPFSLNDGISKCFPNSLMARTPQSRLLPIRASGRLARQTSWFDEL